MVGGIYQLRHSKTDSYFDEALCKTGHLVRFHQKNSIKNDDVFLLIKGIIGQSKRYSKKKHNFRFIYGIFYIFPLFNGPNEGRLQAFQV